MVLSTVKKSKNKSKQQLYTTDGLNVFEALENLSFSNLHASLHLVHLQKLFKIKS